MRSNKLFKFLVFVCLLAPSKVVSQEITESVTYTFNSANWGVVDSDINNSDWVSIIDAAYSNILCLQVPARAVCANSPVYFSNINKVIVSYNSTVEGEIKINCVDSPNAAADSGTPFVASNNVAITGMNAFYDIEYTPQYDDTSGYIQIYATCESNAIYIKSVTVVYTPVVPLPQLSFEKDVYRKTVQAGERFQIKASSPFLNNSINYNSTNQTVACVDEEGRVTALTPGNTIISASIDETEYYSGQRIAYALTVVEPNCDLLTASLFSATNTSYKDFSNVKKDGNNGINSNAVYAGNTATDQYGSIRIRKATGKSDPSGIISTASGGLVKRIEVEWNEDNNNANGVVLQVYGKTKSFSSVGNLTDGSILLNSITYGKTSSFDISGRYSFIGLGVKSGTIYLNSIKIYWDNIGISLASGTYTSQQDVVITSMQDTYIIYTTDNSEPSLDNGIRTDGNSVTLTINSDCTLKAVAVDNDNVVTPVASESYKFVTIVGEGSFDNPYTTVDVRTLYNEKLYNKKKYVWIKGVVGGDTNLTLGDVQITATGDDYLYDVISDNRGKEVVVCGKIDKSSGAVVLKSIIKVSGLCDMPITTKEGYGTFYNDYAYEMPEGVVGYIITDADKTSNKLTLEQVYTGKDLVPSGTSLLLKGEYKTYPVNVISTSKSKPANNLLHGADCVDADGKTLVEGTDVKYYILSYGQEDKALKFHYAVAGGGPIKYQKPYAFLAIDGGTSSRAKGFSFLDNDVSGISDHIIESLQTDKYVYTIEGIRVDHERLAKGLYIVNGKKLYVK